MSHRASEASYRTSPMILMLAEVAILECSGSTLSLVIDIVDINIKCEAVLREDRHTLPSTARAVLLLRPLSGEAKHPTVTHPDRTIYTTLDNVGREVSTPLT